MAFDWEQITEQITDRLNLSKERMAGVVRLLVQAGVVVAIAYVAASGVSAYFMSGMLDKAITAFNRINTRTVTAASINMSTQENYRDIERSIKERNLFNSTEIGRAHV